VGSDPELSLILFGFSGEPARITGRQSVDAGHFRNGTRRAPTSKRGLTVKVFGRKLILNQRARASPQGQCHTGQSSQVSWTRTTAIVFSNRRSELVVRGGSIPATESTDIPRLGLDLDRIYYHSSAVYEGMGEVIEQRLGGPARRLAVEGTRLLILYNRFCQHRPHRRTLVNQGFSRFLTSRQISSREIILDTLGHFTASRKS